MGVTWIWLHVIEGKLMKLTFRSLSCEEHVVLVIRLSYPGCDCCLHAHSLLQNALLGASSLLIHWDGAVPALMGCVSSCWCKCHAKMKADRT